MGSTAVMNLMLGWLKSVANWVLSLFDLAGSTGFSPLQWLSDNWLVTLITLLIIGVVADILVWLLRWRPHWVWFGKKRIVINDDDFFAGEDLVDSGLYDPTLFTEGRRPRRSQPARRRPRADEDDLFATPPRPTRRPAPVRRIQPREEDDLFAIENSSSAFSGGEDEVFNVSDLPVSDDELAFRDSQKRR